jgi:phage tail sheath protein FI
MPEYLAPGVFVEEVRFQPSQIQPASTSVGGMVGPARFGPIGGPPQLLTSFNDFVTYFGDPGKLAVPGSDTNDPTHTLNHSAYAAQMFFDNGGQQLYFSRTAYNVAGAPGASLTSPSPASLSVIVPASGQTPASLALELMARFPGTGGNLDLVLQPSRSAPLLQSSPVTAPVAGTTYLLRLSKPPLTSAVFAGLNPITGLTAIGSLTAVATYTPPPAGAPAGTAAEYVFVPGQPIMFTDQNGQTIIETIPSGPSTTILATGVLPGGVTAPATISVQSVSLTIPNSYGATPVFSIPIGPTMRSLLGVSSAILTLYATATSTAFSATLALNPKLTAPIAGAPLALLAMGGRPGDGGIYYDQYNISIQNNGSTIFTVANVDLDSAGANNFAVAFPKNPTGSAAATQPIFATYNGPQPASALWPLLVGGTSAPGAFDPSALNPPPTSGLTSSFVMHLTNGSDGGALPQAVDYSGADAPGCGLSAFESVDEISIVFCPAAAADPANHQAVVAAMIAHCKKMLYRVAVIDSPPGAALSDVQFFRSLFSDDRTALYYPWVTVASLDPNGGTVSLPPSSFAAGLYAYTDIQRGVFKAPANVVVQDALGFEIPINTAQQEILNPLGINCLRKFTSRGLLVWGARTLSSDPQWQYVNVRRYFLYLEHSLANSTNWVVFEPNGKTLWNEVAGAVSDFLYTEWREGHLLGDTPAQAYFVRCDETTMTQADIDNGRLICVIGVAPLEPAEFVIFRIGKWTASATT